MAQPEFDFAKFAINVPFSDALNFAIEKINENAHDFGHSDNPVYMSESFFTKPHRGVVYGTWDDGLYSGANVSCEGFDTEKELDAWIKSEEKEWKEACDGESDEEDDEDDRHP